MDTLKIMKVREDAIIPKRATEGSAGIDLCACIEEDIVINPGDIVKIPTGIACSVPKNFVSLLFARSGLSVKHGIGLANSVGVIDSDYRGEVIAALINNGKEPYTITKNERIAQLVCMPVAILPIEVCDSLDETERGEGGFGSTGKK
ncbi:MAG: dUTP diphosphatase [Clostridia bacterium]|nr:dUTP diphosphatase [Clostridia bacterium]